MLYVCLYKGLHQFFLQTPHWELLTHKDGHIGYTLYRASSSGPVFSDTWMGSSATGSATGSAMASAAAMGVAVTMADMANIVVRARVAMERKPRMLVGVVLIGEIGWEGGGGFKVI